MKQKFNLPNTLTLIRILLTPVFLFLFLNQNIPNHCLWGLIVFAVGSFTDFLDGKIARARQLITVFGQLADPVADKVLTTAALLAFMDLGLCSIWIVMIVLLREFTVTSFRMVATSQGVVIPANIYGKLKTVSQMVMLCIAGATWVIDGGAECLRHDFLIFVKFKPIIASSLCNDAWFSVRLWYIWLVYLVLIVLVTLLSGLNYFIRYRKLFLSSKEDRPA